MQHVILMAAMLVACVSATHATNWDVYYDGSVLPEFASPSWTRVYPTDGSVTTDGSVLRVQDTTSGYTFYQRDSSAIPAGTPVTMEARVRVAAATDKYAVIMGFQTAGASAFIHLYTDHLTAYYPGVVDLQYNTDLTAFRTVRIAMDSGKNVSLWVDNALALTWHDTSIGGQNGVRFGTSSITGIGDSYWDYVDYSRQFLPVPEPSSLAALLTPLGVAATVVMRRRTSGT